MFRGLRRGGVAECSILSTALFVRSRDSSVARRTAATGSAAKDFATLSSVPLHRDWDFTKPTLVKAQRFVKRAGWATDDAALIEHIVAQYPIVRPLLQAGLSLKGGCFCSLLMEKTPSDLDFYVVANSDEEGLRVVEKALHDVLKFVTSQVEQDARLEAQAAEVRASKLGETGKPPDVVEREIRERIRQHIGQILGIRREGVITLTNVYKTSIPIQISLQSYPTVHRLVDDGDVDAGAIALSAEFPDRLLLAKRAEFAVRNFTIHGEVDGHFLHPFRLKSYFDRGFDIVLPTLDASKITLAPAETTLTPAFGMGSDIFVELEAFSRPQTNRLHVKSFKSEQGGAAGADPNMAATEAASASSVKFLKKTLLRTKRAEVARSSGTKESAASVTVDTIEVNRAIHVKTINENVDALLHGRTAFHALAYGERITTLWNPRDIPVNERDLRNVLEFNANLIRRHPITESSIVTLMKKFPIVNAAEFVTSLIVDDDHIAAIAQDDRAASTAALVHLRRQHVDERMSDLVQKQATVASERLAQLDVSLQTMPLSSFWRSRESKTGAQVAYVF